MIYLFGVLIFDIILVLLSNVLPKKKGFRIAETLLFILPLIILCSLKSVNVGNDTPGYLTSYNESVLATNSGLYTGDIGFLYLEYLFKSIKIPYFIFLLFCYTIVYGGLALFSTKKSNNPLLAMLFVTYFGLFGFSLSGLRQSLSIGLLLIGYSFFDEKKPISIISPIFFTLVASTIHKTSFFGLIVGIILLIKFSKTSFIYLVLSLASLIIISPLVYSGVIVMIHSTYYPNYSNTAWTLLFYLLFIVLTFFLTNKKTLSYLNKTFGKFDKFARLKVFSFSTSNEEAGLLTNFVASILYPLLVLSVGVYNSTFSRVYYYLVPFTALFIVNLMNKKNVNPFIRGLLDILLIIFLAGYFVYSVLIKNPLNVAQYTIGPMI